MSDRLTWPRFRANHKDLDKERISELWSQYKKDEYDGSAEIPYDGVGGMTVEEEFHTIIKVAEIVTDENPSLLEDEAVEIGESDEWPDGDHDEGLEVAASPAIPEIPKSDEQEIVIVESEEDPIWRKVLSISESLDYFKQITTRLIKFQNKLGDEDIEEANLRLKHIAKFSRPEDYVCEKTDAWTVWMGPSTQCILVNTSKNLAFTCSRAWWKRNYDSALYVERKLVDDAAFLENLEGQYRRRKRFVPRNPLPNIEIKLPKTVRDFVLRRE